MAEKIIDAVDRKLIINELTEETFLRHSSKLRNQLYLVNYHNSPNIMREIGRLRELTFREAGGGTGKSADIDSYDTAAKPFDQLILWDPEDQEIIAGYRLKKCKDAETNSEGKLETPTSHLFDISETFHNQYMPTTMELGRSFVQPRYQSGAGSKKGLFSLDNLWDGLGAVVALNPDIEYLFGKVTMYPHFNREARNYILGFLNHYFEDKEGLLKPRKALVTEDELLPFQKLFEGLGYKEGYTALNKEVRQRDENIPPLINIYMNLSPTMKSFGTAANYAFGAVEETGILVTLADIYPEKKERHIESFEQNNTYIGPLKKMEEPSI